MCKKCNNTGTKTINGWKYPIICRCNCCTTEREIILIDIPKIQNRR